MPGRSKLSWTLGSACLKVFLLFCNKLYISFLVSTKKQQQKQQQKHTPRKFYISLIHLSFQLAFSEKFLKFIS